MRQAALRTLKPTQNDMSNFPFGAEKKSIPIIIPAGATETAAIDLNGGALVGIEMPSAWTEAQIKVQVKGQDDVWRPLYNESGEIVLDAYEDIHLSLSPGIVYGHRAVKLVSTEIQEAERKIVAHIAYL